MNFTLGGLFIRVRFFQFFSNLRSYLACNGNNSTANFRFENKVAFEDHDHFLRVRTGNFSVILPLVSDHLEDHAICWTKDSRHYYYLIYSIQVNVNSNNKQGFW